MSGIYRNKSGINMISGTVEAISPDRKEVSVKTTEGNRETHQLEEKVFKATFDGAETLKEDIHVGDTITVAGYQNGQNSISAKYAEHENGYFKASDDLVILSGEVLFANKNVEKDENGQPRLNKAGAEKKPHFDITIAVGTGKDRVNHVVKVYDFAAKEGKPAQENIARFEKIFANFDRKTNPIYITIATGEGQPYTKTNTKGDTTYENKYESHLGFKSFNVQFLNSLNKDKGAEKAADAPAKDAPAPANNADALDFDLDAIDDMDMDIDI
jgi:hypothetical protein